MEWPDDRGTCGQRSHDEHPGFLPATGSQAGQACSVLGAMRILHRSKKLATNFESRDTIVAMGEWSFLTNHARALLFIANNAQARLRDLAVALDVTERTAYAIVVDLTESGYVVKERDGRRNRYEIQDHLPLRDSMSRKRTIGEVLDLLADSNRDREVEQPMPLRGP
jgi:DNA-binding transcriptional ArsR family regulator